MATQLDEWPEDPRSKRRRERAAEAQRRVEALRNVRYESGIVDRVAAEMDVAASTVRKYLRSPEHDPEPTRAGGSRRLGRASLTAADVKEAIHAWWDRHERPPTVTDWTPSLLKHRLRRRGMEERLAAFEEGWTDADGTRRRFPSARGWPLKELIEEVRRERH